MALTAEQLAHESAAICALHTVQKHGLETGTEILRGYAVAFARALGAVTTAEEAGTYINQHMPVPKNSKPKLVFDRTVAA